MNIDPRQYLSTALSSIRAHGRSRVAWWAGSEQRSGDRSRAPWVAIIGREYYAEHSERFAVSSWWDLRSAMRLRAAGRSDEIFHIGPWVDGHRVVRFYRLVSPLPDFVSSAWFWIPETLALDHSMQERRIHDVARFGTRYFFVANNLSQIRGGVLDNESVFALAAGVSDSTVSSVDESSLLDQILNGIPKLPITGWLDFFNRGRSARLGAQARPIAIFLASAFIGYLLLATGYLLVMTSVRERQIASLGPSVGGLIEKQRLVDRMSDEYESLVGILSQRTVTYSVWEFVKPLWDLEGTLSGVSVSPGSVIVRGSAKSATEVLEKVAALNSVQSAKFDSPVRENMGRQEFSIRIAPKTSAGSPR